MEDASRTRLGGVRHVFDDRAYLFQVIETIGSGPDLTAILRGIVRLVTEATHCHACFVYFEQDGELVLRAASREYTHLEGRVHLGIGEGLTGWVARTRRSAFIRDRALEDPRVRYFPELEDEQFQSLVSVPILSRASEVIGVITLHAVAPHEFGRPDLDFLEHTAALVAGAIENARLYEDATRRVALLTDISKISQQIASASSVGELLAIVASDCRALSGASHCEIYLWETDRRLALKAASPRREQAPAMGAAELWLDAIQDREPLAAARESRTLAEALWDGAAGTPLFVPLAVGEEQLGVLCVLVEHPAPGIASALAAISSQTAVAIKKQQLIEWLQEKNLVKDLFEALSSGDGGTRGVESQARRLEVDLRLPHVLLHAIPWNSRPQSRRVGGRPRARTARRAPPELHWSERSLLIEAGIIRLIPGALFDHREASLRALIPVSGDDPDHVAATVREVFDEIAGSEPPALTMGLSDTCEGAGSVRRGFEEAAAAAQTGALLRGAAGVFTYQELGSYRYALMSDESVRDRYQGRIERLVDYERRRGTQLLSTLETYLDARGNLMATSRQLFIHPNTLRQRLARVERICGLDLHREDWLSLAIAVKVVKLRWMRRSALEEGREDG